MGSIPTRSISSFNSAGECHSYKVEVVGSIPTTSTCKALQFVYTESMNTKRWWRRIGATNDGDYYRQGYPGKATKAIFRKDLCSFCGGPGGTLDHIHPKKRAKGPQRGNYMNYTGACSRCNNEKGGGHFLYFFAIKAGKPVLGYDHDPRGHEGSTT